MRKAQAHERCAGAEAMRRRIHEAHVQKRGRMRRRDAQAQNMHRRIRGAGACADDAQAHTGACAEEAHSKNNAHAQKRRICAQEAHMRIISDSHKRFI